jgi:hypothetical protein
VGMGGNGWKWVEMGDLFWRMLGLVTWGLGLRLGLGTFFLGHHETWSSEPGALEGHQNVAFFAFQGLAKERWSTQRRSLLVLYSTQGPRTHPESAEKEENRDNFSLSSTRSRLPAPDQVAERSSYFAKDRDRRAENNVIAIL